MTCDELKNIAQSGRLPAKLAELDVRAHLAQCAECEALYGANPQVVRVLVDGLAANSSAKSGDAVGFELGDLEALRAEVNALLVEETKDGWNFLRDRKTSVRRSLALVVIGVVFLGCLALNRRSDLADYPLLRLVIELGLLFALVGAAVWDGTRTLVEPPGESKRRAIVAVCVAAPVVLAFGSSLAPVTHTHGTSNFHSVASCLSWGTAVALPVAFILWLCKRENPWEEARVPLLAATLGVVGNLLLQIHCPSSEFAHLICAHAPLLLVFALGFGVWGKVAKNRAAH